MRNFLTHLANNKDKNKEIKPKPTKEQQLIAAVNAGDLSTVIKLVAKLKTIAKQTQKKPTSHAVTSHQAVAAVIVPIILSAAEQGYTSKTRHHILLVIFSYACRYQSLALLAQPPERAAATQTEQTEYQSDIFSQVIPDEEFNSIYQEGKAPHPLREVYTGIFKLLTKAKKNYTGLGKNPLLAMLAPLISEGWGKGVGSHKIWGLLNNPTGQTGWSSLHSTFTFASINRSITYNQQQVEKLIKELETCMPQCIYEVLANLIIQYCYSLSLEDASEQESTLTAAQPQSFLK